MEYTLTTGYVIPYHWDKFTLRGLPHGKVITVFKQENKKEEFMSKERLLELKKVYEDQLKEKKDRFDSSIAYYLKQLEEHITLCKEMDELQHKIWGLESDFADIK